MSTKGGFLSYIFILTAVVLWGFSFVWTNELIRYDVPIFVFIFIRMVISGALMLIFSKCIGKLQKIEGSDLKWFFLMSLFEPFIYFIGESYGLKLTDSATLTAVVIATIPVFTLIVGQIIYKEQLTWMNKAGVLLTLPGVVLFVWDSGGISVKYIYGILFLILAVFGSVGYTTICKKLSDKYNAFTITTYQFVIASLYFLIPFLFLGLPHWNNKFLSIDVIKPLLMLAFFCSCLAFLLYVQSIKNLGMTKSVIFTSLIPAVSAMGAYFAGQEVFNFQQIAGMVIVLAGVISAQIKLPGFSSRQR